MVAHVVSWLNWLWLHCVLAMLHCTAGGDCDRVIRDAYSTFYWVNPYDILAVRQYIAAHAYTGTHTHSHTHTLSHTHSHTPYRLKTWKGQGQQTRDAGNVCLCVRVCVCVCVCVCASGLLSTP